MNIVTKSGTNDLHGSWLRAVPRRVDERAAPRPSALANADKQDYRRNQFGGSVRRPDRARTGRTSSPRSSGRSRTPARRSTRRACSPIEGRHLRHAVSRERCSPARPRRTSRRALPDGALRPQQQLRSRTAPPRPHPRQLGRQQEQVQLDQRESQLGRWAGSMLNEFVFQYADFANHITARSTDAVRSSSRTA